MTITIIKDTNLQDAKQALAELLGKGIQDEDVRQVALSITQSGREDNITSVYLWVQSNVRYIPDPSLPEGIELFTSPIRMVKDYRQGKPLAEDCDGIALLTGALLGSIGYEVRLSLLGDSSEITHVIAEVNVPQIGWVLVDASTDKVPLGWEESYPRRLYVYPT